MEYFLEFENSTRLQRTSLADKAYLSRTRVELNLLKFPKALKNFLKELKLLKNALNSDLTNNGVDFISTVYKINDEKYDFFKDKFLDKIKEKLSEFGEINCFSNSVISTNDNYNFSIKNIDENIGTDFLIVQYKRCIDESFREFLEDIELAIDNAIPLFKRKFEILKNEERIEYCEYTVFNNNFVINASIDMHREVEELNRHKRMTTLLKNFSPRSFFVYFKTMAVRKILENAEDTECEIKENAIYKINFKTPLVDQQNRKLTPSSYIYINNSFTKEEYLEFLKKNKGTYYIYNIIVENTTLV